MLEKCQTCVIRLIYGIIDEGHDEGKEMKITSVDEIEENWRRDVVIFHFM